MSGRDEVLSLRHGQQDAAQAPLADFVQSNRDQFGGIWATREDLPVLHYHVGYVTGDQLSKAQALVPEGLDVEFHNVSNSEAQLLAAADALAAAEDKQRGDNADSPLLFNVARVDLARNLVVVEATDTGTASSLVAQAGYRDDLVVVEKGSVGDPVSGCSHTNDAWNQSRAQCLPPRGGVLLEKTSTHSNGHCTMTLWGEKDGSSTGAMISGAHCDTLGSGTNTVVWEWNCTGYPEGSYSCDHSCSALSGLSSYFYGYHSTGRYCEDFSPPSTNRNIIYTDPSVAGYHIDSTPNSPAGTVGSAQRCVSGGGISESDPYECGYLSVYYATGISDPGTGHTFTGGACDCNGAASGNGLSGGDSGAPIFGYGGSDKLFGIAVTSGGYYGFSDYWADDMNVSWCTNSDCSTSEH